MKQDAGLLTSSEDENRISLTQGVREKLINKLVAKIDSENGLEKEDKSLLISLLDGMDRTVLTKARIKADTKQSDNQAQVVSLMANLLNNINPNKLKVYDPNKEMPTLPKDLELPAYIDGENTEGIVNSNYETFMSKFPKEE